MKAIITSCLAATAAIAVSISSAQADDSLRAVIRDVGKDQRIVTYERVAPTVALSVGNAQASESARRCPQLCSDARRSVHPAYIRKGRGD
jgi:hypothetical protein